MDLNQSSRASLGPEDVAELRSQNVRALVVAMLFLAAGVLWHSTLAPWTDLMQPYLVASGLAVTAGLTYILLRRGVEPAALVMIIGLSVTLTALMRLYPEMSSSPYFVLIVLAAAGIGDWRYGLASAILCTLDLILVIWDVPHSSLPGDGARTLFLVWSSLSLVWIITRPLRTVADWAWSNYALALAKMEESRHRQAELGRLAKSLRESYDRLETLNRELAEARAAADVARRLKAEFAATVGHELRTPVNLIVGLSELLYEAGRDQTVAEPLPESYRQDVEVIYRNACHISQLVDDILDLSQVDAHRMALHKDWIALSEIVQQAADSVSVLCASVGLYLAIRLPPDLPPVLADPVRIRQVLINLFYNAIRFTNQGGITVTAFQDGPTVVVAVSDTGIGIPPDDLPRLFEEFRQVQRPARGHRGTGFGLAVCKRFVELHGGNIWATSTPGGGSTFYFSLPLQENVVPVVARPPSCTVTRAAAERRRLAVLDETDDAARVLQRYLDGYEVIPVGPRSSAFRHPEKRRVEAVVLTSASAEQTWHELCRRHPNLVQLPTIVCPMRTRAALAESLGVDDYLVKPVNRQQLARAVRRLNPRAHRFLVIDDDDEIRNLFVRMLRSLSPRHEVVEARDGEVGLQLIRQERPDIVLLDLLLPGTNGFAVLEQLRQDESLRHIAVIVISGKGLNEEIVAHTVQVRCAGGLSVAEAVKCLQASLDVLLANRPGTAPALPAGSAG